MNLHTLESFFDRALRREETMHLRAAVETLVASMTDDGLNRMRAALTELTDLVVDEQMARSAADENNGHACRLGCDCEAEVR